jgi:Protein of unknown function (DUF1648)
MKAARAAFTVLLALALVQLIFYCPRLPERVASHFDAAGQPNGWSSRTGYVGLQLFVLFVLALCFAVLPARLPRLPDRFINLSNKGYWLAAGRRETTLRKAGAALTWFGCAALSFVIAVTWLVMRYNLGRDPALPSRAMWLLLASFAVCVGVLIAYMMRLGRRRPG